MYVFEWGVGRVLYSTVGCALSISHLKCESRQTHRLPYSTVSTHRWTDRQTHRLAYSTYRQTDRLAYGMYRHTDRQTDTQVNMQADTGTETQADTPAGHAPVGERGKQCMSYEVCYCSHPRTPCESWEQHVSHTMHPPMPPDTIRPHMSPVT